MGGHNLLPMKEFVALLKQLNFEGVSSYINSGNVVLKSKTNPLSVLEQIIAEHYGFSPELFILNKSEFSAIVADNPYTQFEGKFVHLYFCKNPIELNKEKLTKLIASSERYQLKGNVIYLHTPDGIGRSRLVAHIESCLGQPATGRNLNTVIKISEMVKNA